MIVVVLVLWPRRIVGLLVVLRILPISVLAMFMKPLKYWGLTAVENIVDPNCLDQRHKGNVLVVTHDRS